MAATSAAAGASDYTRLQLSGDILKTAVFSQPSNCTDACFSDKACKG